jgi:hypothetical protein
MPDTGRRLPQHRPDAQALRRRREVSVAKPQTARGIVHYARLRRTKRA